MIRTVLLIAIANAAMFACAPAQARQADARERPPERFTTSRPLWLVIVPETEIEAVCARVIGERGRIGCAKDGTVYATEPCDDKNDSYAQRLCHEKGHVNGWPPDHKDKDLF